MAYYDDIPIQDNAGNTHYPRTKYNSVYNASGTERLDNKLVEIDTIVNSLASGAPKAVSLVSQMTDNTKNYVYIGVEAGYTAGNWYYWNGSAWISGGVYQATGIADNSVKTSHINDSNITISKLEDNIKKWSLSYVYIGYAFQPIVLETADSVLFNLPNETATIAVRPVNGYSIVKTWTDIKQIFASNLTIIDGVTYVVIGDGKTLVANGLTGTLEIIHRDTILPFVHVPILMSNAGVATGGIGKLWATEWKLKLLTDKVNNLENGTSNATQYIQDEVKDTIDKVEEVSTNKSLVFSIVTDSHYDGINYFDTTSKNIQEVNKVIKSDAIIHMGDIVSGDIAYDETKTIMNKAYKLLRETYLPVFGISGNHDDNSYGTNKLISNLIISDKWYGLTQRQIDNIPSVTRESNKPYFYVDYQKLKIRAIFLHAIDYDLVDDGSGAAVHDGENYWGYSQEQMIWLGETALNTENDYGVLVFSHMPTRAELNYSSVDNIQFGAIVENILQAYTSHTSYIYTAASKTFNFTAKTGTEVIAYVYGHTHGDSVRTLAGLDYPYISIACSSPTQIPSQYLPVGSVAPIREIGTVTEDCWDVMVLRPDERKIYFTRFGAGDDRVVNY